VDHQPCEVNRGFACGCPLIGPRRGKKLQAVILYQPINASPDKSNRTSAGPGNCGLAKGATSKLQFFGKLVACCPTGCPRVSNAGDGIYPICPAAVGRSAGMGYA
jgi:hypothetical protein